MVDQVIRDILWKAGGNLDAMRGYFESVFNELLAVAESRAVLEPKVVATERRRKIPIIATAKLSESGALRAHA